MGNDKKYDTQSISIDNNRKITIFLASSNELDNDRVSFRDLVDSLDDIYKPHGIRVRCKNWRAFPETTDERSQAEYDAVTTKSDICICMFHREAGKDTLDEFHQSLNAYKRTGNHPKTYVYIRALVDGEIETEELAQFKKDLFDKMGHYWCNYATEDSMKLHFVMQFERMLNGELVPSREANLKVHQGEVLLYGKKIADYKNLHFASENSEIKNLKGKISALDKDITELRVSNVEALRPMIDAKLSERNDCLKQLEQLEKQLLSMALSISKMISIDNPISERKRLAIEMFEKGNNQGILEILNEADIETDYQRARREIASGKELKSAADAMIESAEQKVRSLVEELVMSAQTWMNTFSKHNRFEEACKCYEKAIQYTRESLPDEDLAERLFEYGVFLYEQKQYRCVESCYREALCIYNRLVETTPEKYESYVAQILLGLAALYYDQKDIINAEAYHLIGLSIFERLASTTPELYEMDIAFALKGLAARYSDVTDTKRLKEAEDKLHRAISIIEQWVATNPAMYEFGLASALNDLALLYTKTERIKEAEEFYLRALSIYERLAISNSDMYEPHLATVLNNLALLYSRNRFHDSEKYHSRALSNRKRLAANNPEKYESDLAITLNNIAYLYSLNKNYKKAEEYYLHALSIYQRLAAIHRDVYGLDVAHILVDITLLYTLMKRFKKAKKFSLRALPFIENLASNNYAVYAEILSSAKKLHQTIIEKTN